MLCIGAARENFRRRICPIDLLPYRSPFLGKLNFVRGPEYFRASLSGTDEITIKTIPVGRLRGRHV